MNAPAAQLLHPDLAIAQRLAAVVLSPMKAAFVGKDEVIDLLGVCLVAGENCFILGPPGTAKSALIQDLGRRLAGRTFDYLLTRFTEPNELFGPFDIRRLKEGDLVTNTEGMLPEADLVFLDELLNANSAVLNSLLMVLNERVFRRGRETRRLPLLMTVGASNRLPEEESLRALFDRFLVRVRSDNVPDAGLSQVLEVGWAREVRSAGEPTLPIEDLKKLGGLLQAVDLQAVREPYLAIVRRLRQSGMALSDRRAVKLQRLVAASALICGRLAAMVQDLWILRHIWDVEEQRELIAAVVQTELDRVPSAAGAHPQAARPGVPDAERLASDLAAIDSALSSVEQELPADERARLRDRLSALASRVPWVADETERSALQARLDALWARVP